MQFNIDWKRIGAYLIDWFLSGILIGLPCVIIFPLVTGSQDIFSDLYVFSAMGYSVSWSYLCFVCSLAVFLFYFIFIPFRIWRGQTLGKRFCHLQIVSSNGEPICVKQLIIRHAFCLLLIEGVSTIMSRYVRQIITLASGFYFEGYLIPIAYLLTMVSAALAIFGPKKLALHDRLADTKIVHLNKNLIKYI